MHTLNQNPLSRLSKEVLGVADVKAGADKAAGQYAEEGDASVDSRPVVGLCRGYKELLQLLAELLELLLGEASAYLGDGLELLGILVVDR